jgi:hypothetical protein
MRKSRMLERCLLRILRMSDLWHSYEKAKDFWKEATLLYMLVFLCYSICGFFSCSIPYAYHCRSEDLHHNHRAEVCAGKYIPCVFLRTPQSILQDRMISSTPEKSRSRPHNPRIELVMQRSGAKHTNRIG